MKRSRIITLIGLLGLATLFALSPFAFAEETTIDGMVVEEEGDEDGNLVKVAISGGSGYYIVVNSSILVPHVGENVEATGTISEDDLGNQVITVSNFKVLTE